MGHFCFASVDGLLSPADCSLRFIFWIVLHEEEIVAQVQDTSTPGKLGNFRFYLRQRPVMLALLTGLAVVFFLVVTWLSSVYHSQREGLGERWFSRGEADLAKQRFGAAVTEFRAALLYSPDNYTYQLDLAEALIGRGQIPQAYAYLVSLWDREPEDGLVNLELARIAAQRTQIEQAIRYYHNAEYAAWSSDQENQRRKARLELIDLLLRNHQPAQAQAELIALAENAGEDPAEQKQLGDFFIRAGDYEHALGAYRVVLKSDHHNAAAMAGAGYASFQLARYPLAEHYLQIAVTANPNDRQSADLLKTVESVLHLDPFRPQLSTAERNRIVMDAFEVAGERLKDCTVTKAPPPNPASVPSTSDQWTSLKPEITVQRLEHHPELAAKAMDIVFQAERETSIACGAPTGTDLALLLIGKLHEGS